MRASARVPCLSWVSRFVQRDSALQAVCVSIPTPSARGILSTAKTKEGRSFNKNSSGANLRSGCLRVKCDTTRLYTQADWARSHCGPAADILAVGAFRKCDTRFLSHTRRTPSNPGTRKHTPDDSAGLSAAGTSHKNLIGSHGACASKNELFWETLSWKRLFIASRNISGKIGSGLSALKSFVGSGTSHDFHTSRGKVDTMLLVMASSRAFSRNPARVLGRTREMPRDKL